MNMRIHEEDDKQELRLPEVTRIHHETGYRIVPRMEMDWNDDDKIAWQAAIVAMDTGESIRVFAHLENHRRYYSINIRNYSRGSTDFFSAWDWLNGFSVGYTTALETVQRNE